MPEIQYTQAQKDKIAKAQGRLDNAKSSYQTWVTTYSNTVAGVQPCYKNVIEDAAAAASWFNPTTPPCQAKGSCKVSDCKDTIDIINDQIIPSLRSAYAEQNAAQANFTQVLNEVGIEAANDPANKKAIEEAKAGAEESEKTKQAEYWFWGIALVVTGFLIFAYFKWFRKVAPIAG